MEIASGEWHEIPRNSYKELKHKETVAYFLRVTGLPYQNTRVIFFQLFGNFDILQQKL